MKLSTLESVFLALNHASVRYLVAGGVAVNIHGYQRMTSDLDLVINLDADNIKKTLAALEPLGYSPIIPVSANDFANAEKRNDWINNKNMQVLSLQSYQYPDTTIDIFVTEPFDFKIEYNTSLSTNIFADVAVRVVSIPTLIVMKTQAGRNRDLDDIEHLNMILDEQNNP
ncbi:MAG: nucleotidyl transferase AbiEii/AbiGii toxin family protein [Gammaproteobacteria bacterium]|nr:nucleotidyl transferase AbiEii/AbiGii toxin family protein [Gammaproteobacteria bacterium]